MEKAHDQIVDKAKLSSGAPKELIVICREIYTDDILNSAEECLKNAEAKAAAAAEKKYSQRVAFIRSGYDFSRMQVGIMNAMAKVRESKGADTAAVKKAIELCEKRNEFYKKENPIAIRAAPWYHDGRQLNDYMGPPSKAFRDAAGIE